ncbi:MAG TPA: STAS domain-containing protein, partial [Ramlibacter sp.]|nr:STAS domain-containing protein [Ramlibacter sp.]
GLLSRVVRFVKKPGTTWAEAEAADTDRESSYSKQMLKEMIERKRRNDFVRKREFDMLRKMRRSEVLSAQDAMARPSFFQSSMPSRPDDRATTLKKIDEIEAQMSMQWWKTKHGSASSNNSGFVVSSHIPPDVMRAGAAGSAAYSRTAPQELRPGTPVAVDGPLLDSVLPESSTRGPLAPTPQSAFAETPSAAPSAHAPLAPASMAGGLPEAASARPAAVAVPRPAASLFRRDGATSQPNSMFSPSKQDAIDVGEYAHDPELEEAAIRFANGDDEGAEAGLMEVLGPEGARADHEETWLTLFDLYRAIGRQDRFEHCAIEFANRFGRSAPQWFSLPEIIGRMSAPATSATPLSQQIADWTCPAVFGTQTLAALQAALAKATPPYRLNWSKLTSIAEPALAPLTRAFTEWARQPVQLRFIGAEVLEKVLRDATPSGDRAVNPEGWKLRMEAMRVMHRPDEFELVALDYCVTYEVSPPSWERARCEYKALQADGSYAGGHTIVGDAARDSVMSSLLAADGDTQVAGMTSQLASIATVELSGQILGDGKEAMDLLDAKLGDADVMVVSCARLMRIDFTAAGTLLNWVSAREAEGRQVQFVEVPRLVAAFFNVIGISEHARVGLRYE